MNILSISFYLFLVQVFAGAALIMLGLDQHHTLRRLVNRGLSSATTYYVVMAVAILWPVCMWGFAKLFKVDSKTRYREYLGKPTKQRSSQLTFWIVLAFSVLCLSLLGCTCAK